MQLSKPGIRFSYLLKHMSAYIKAGEGTELSCTKAANVDRTASNKEHTHLTIKKKKNPHRQQSNHNLNNEQGKAE